MISILYKINYDDEETGNTNKNNVKISIKKQGIIVVIVLSIITAYLIRYFGMKRKKKENEVPYRLLFDNC
jgi:hypothetical protein